MNTDQPAGRGVPDTPPGVWAISAGPWVAWVLPFGARLMQLWWLGAPEGPRPLTLGYADPLSYRADTMALGAVCGRYANRIGGAQLEREGQRWALDANHPLGHCIHGGRGGFGVRDWQVLAHGPDHVTLQLDSPDGDQGFPGRCVARVTYRLDEGGLEWTADATLDAPCPLNLVQHSYWNLDATPTVHGQRLWVDANDYLPTDAQELPLPSAPVAGGLRDFRTDAPLTAEHTAALDNALLLKRPPHTAMTANVARLSGRDLVLSVQTDRPLLHLYAASGLRPSAAPLGVAHGPGAGLCLETEDWPNGPALGQPVWYGPDRPYRHRLRLALSVDQSV